MSKYGLPRIRLEEVRTSADFGRALNELRESAGLTVRMVAKRLDSPLSTISGYLSGRHLPPLSQRELLKQMLLLFGIATSDELNDWMSCWARVRSPLGRPPTSGVSPYRGLECFQPEHASWFFGRAEETATLLAGITDLTDGGLVVLVGPSGSGKSSVLRAGVIAALSHSDENAIKPWQCVLVTPGSRPIAALARQLSLMNGESVDQIERLLRTEPQRCIERICRQVGRSMLIVVDQLEEIFSVCADESEREIFASIIQIAAEVSRASVDSPRRAPVVVLAGIRADFYGSLLQYPYFAHAAQSKQIVLGPMEESELRKVIVEPALKANLQLDDGLVSLLLHELRGAQAAARMSALPLLSHVLLSTWQQGSLRTMTVADYAATGGISGAIAQTAECTFTELSTLDQDLSRRLFLRLVQVGDETTDTRRRVDLDEIAAHPEVPQYDQIRHVVSRYVSQRLITANANSIEISHEALLYAWPRLREWINVDREGHRIHRQLTDAARVWMDSGNNSSLLYRGLRLESAVDWVEARGHQGDLNLLERQFFDSSVTAAEAERTRERRRTLRLYRLVAALIAVILIAGGLTVYSFEQRASASHERDLAISRQIAGTAARSFETDPALAAQLSLAAYRIAPTIEARSNLISTSARPQVTRMLRPGGSLQAVTVSADGELVVMAGATRTDNDIHLWNLDDPAQPVRLDLSLTGHAGAIYAATLSPDNATLATGSADKTVRLWDVSDPDQAYEVSGPLTGASDRVLAVAFSSDGLVLAAAGNDKMVRLWDVRDKRNPEPLGRPLGGAAGAVQSLAFNPDSSLLAGADASGGVVLWDMRDLLRPRFSGLLPVPSRVNTVVFSPDGRVLAAGSNDGFVRLWDMTNPAVPTASGEPLPAGTGWINAIAFSSAGDTLAAGSADNSVQIWRLADRSTVASLAHPEPVTAVAFRNNDAVLFTNSADGAVRRWAIPGATISTSGRSTTSLRFHPNGTHLADAGRTIKLWDISDPHRPADLPVELSAPSEYDRLGGTVAISSDRKMLAAGSRTGNDIVLWDIVDPEEPRLLGYRLSGHDSLIEHIEFSPNGHILASASNDGTVRLWGPSGNGTFDSLSVLDAKSGYIFSVAFSPDSQSIAAASQHGLVSIWNVQDPRSPVLRGPPLVVGPDYVYSVVISPDARTLATGSANGTVQLWDIADIGNPRMIGSPIVGPDGYMHALAFSPDGQMLAGGSGTGQTWIWDIRLRDQPQTFAILNSPKETIWDLEFSSDGLRLAGVAGNIYIWEIDPNRTAERICQFSGELLTPVEWAKHIPGVDYQDICSI